MLSHSVIKLNHMEIHCDDVEWIQEARYMGQAGAASCDRSNEHTDDPWLSIRRSVHCTHWRRGYNKNS